VRARLAEFNFVAETKMVEVSNSPSRLAAILVRLRTALVVRRLELTRLRGRRITGKMRVPAIFVF
jgi:hypothetical protein